MSVLIVIRVRVAVLSLINCRNMIHFWSVLSSFCDSVNFLPLDFRSFSGGGSDGVNDYGTIPAEMAV